MAEDGAVAGLAPWRGEERGMAGKERSGLDARAQPRWGSSRGWLDAVTGVGSDASAGGVLCEAVAGVEATSGRGLGPDVWAVALPKALSTV